MASERVANLTRHDIIKAAKSFKWNRPLPKWTTLVEGAEYPVRPLVLGAAGVPPNDRTNSHGAVAKLQELGFTVRYEGKQI